MSSYSIDLNTVATECCLTELHRSRDYDQVRISVTEINRPGLQLAGFYDYFDPRRIQILGKVELTFLATMSEQEQHERLERYMSSGIRVLVVAHVACNDQVPPAFLEMAGRYDVNLFCINMRTSAFMGLLIVKLNNWLAPRLVMHGVLMEICGEGVLICGESGVGKSETAMALLRQGHRLVADDAVEIRRINHDTLQGSSPELIRYFMEVRGIGVVDARHLFGIGAVKPEQNIDLVVRFEQWDSNKAYDRLGLEQETTTILGVEVPLNVIPVRPGRNLGSILELAAMNNREKKMGYNAAQVLVDRYDKIIDAG